MSSTSKRKRFLISLAYWVTIFAIFALCLKYILPLVLPFVIAFVYASLVQKPAAAITGVLPRKPCIAVLLTLLIAVSVTLLILLGGALIGQLGEFAAGLPAIAQQTADSLLTSLARLAERLDGRLGELLSVRLEQLRQDIPGTLILLVQWLSEPLLSSAGALGEAAMRLPSVMISVMVAFIASYFIALDYEGVKRLVLGLFPPSSHERLRRIKHYSADTVAQLLRTYAFFMLLTFTELAIGFAAINLAGAEIAYVVPLAFLIALVDILPVLGVGTVLLPWVVIDLLGGNMLRALLLAVLYAVVVLVRNFLEPKLVGQRFGLSPVLTLLAIYVGGKVFGFVGVFALPLTLIILRRLKDAGAFSAHG